MTYGQYKNERGKRINDIFDKHEVFFAFSRSQLEEKKQAGVKYYSLDGGMFIPQANYDAFNEEFEQEDEKHIAEAKKLFGAKRIICYELANHEYCYTYDLTDTKEALEDFGFSEEDYQEAIKEYLSKCEEC